MNEIKAHPYLVARCVGCQKYLLVGFEPVVYVIEEPKLACSETCLERYAKSYEAHLETESKVE